MVFDTLRKYLEYRGKKVRFIQNFTDVDDKIINKAKEEGVSPAEISENISRSITGCRSAKRRESHSSSEGHGKYG